MSYQISEPVLSQLVGVWTPVLAVATPGDFAQTLTVQAGFYQKTGKLVTIHINMAWSSFTWTTASGVVTITGVPFPCRSTSNYWAQGAFSFGGITNAGYTQLTGHLTSTAASTVNFLMSGSGNALNALSVVSIPTGGTVRLRGSISYETD